MKWRVARQILFHYFFDINTVNMTLELWRNQLQKVEIADHGNPKHSPIRIKPQ
jgi:hypothetical protein